MKNISREGLGWRACQLIPQKRQSYLLKIAKVFVILLIIKVFVVMIIGLVIMVRNNKLVDTSSELNVVAKPEIIVPRIESFMLISGATITAYNSEVGQTDSDPFITASNVHVYDGLIACPVKYAFGTKVEYAGRVYTCDDRMNERYRTQNRFDIWFASHAAADDFGTKYNQTVKIILGGKI
jgi:hypothetical protein